MRYPVLVMFLMLELFILSACGGNQPAAPATQTPDAPSRPNQMPPANPNITPPVLQATLTGNGWILISYGATDNPATAVPNTEARITFQDDGQVNGNTGCNNFAGRYQLDGDKISFSQLAMTMMACEGPVGQQEMEVLNGLNNAERYVIEENQLKIFYAGGSKALIYAADLPKL